MSFDYQHWSGSMKDLRTQAPEITKSFGSMFQGLMGEGTLSVREKELIALGIALAQRCEPCIWSHTEKCLKAGASADQIRETAGVTVVMGGGPAYTYVPKVFEALAALAPKA